jgi:hypothetical protein
MVSIEQKRDKSVLVGITYLGHDGTPLREEAFLGRIVRSSARGGLVVRRADGSELEMPPQVEKAEPGEYRLDATGEVIVDPYYLASWSVKAPARDRGRRWPFWR